MGSGTLLSEVVAFVVIQFHVSKLVILSRGLFNLVPLFHLVHLDVQGCSVGIIGSTYKCGLGEIRHERTYAELCTFGLVLIGVTGIELFVILEFFFAIRCIFQFDIGHDMIDGLVHTAFTDSRFCYSEATCAQLARALVGVTETKTFGVCFQRRETSLRNGLNAFLGRT